MKGRIDPAKVSPEAYKAVLGVESYVRRSVEKSLLELVKVRASQMNGCAYCIDMHWKDARAAGESEQRLYSLDAWREAPFYSDRERAALEWTEAVTRISETHAPDDVFEQLQEHFSEKEIADLTLAVALINLWNRLAISLRSVPGEYQPARNARQHAAVATA
jgi:AhpD family alkylhydroperoxidase